MRGTRRRWWLYIAGAYLLLLVLSVIWQAWSAARESTPPNVIVEAPALATNGEKTGKTIRLAYRQAGAGEETIILLHGSPGSSSNFDEITPHLAARYRVIAVDLPGFGDSTRYVPDYGIDIHARYLSAFMDELGIESAHVVGFSQGSGPALHLAARAPERVESITMLAAIGIQEGEGSGDYHFEHLKYAVGYAFVVVAPELLPHFGLLGSRGHRHAFIRNFFDTDQRPLRAILENLEQPLLIIHGKDDFLIPPWVAVEHHTIVAHSELVMLDGSHFMIFFESDAERIAEEIGEFVARYSDPPRNPSRRTENPFDIRMPGTTQLAAGLDLRHGMSPWVQMGFIILATYILEDPTTIVTGLLIKEGHLDLFVGLFAIFIGIFSGDIGLYLLGFVVGRRILRWRPIARRLPTRHMHTLGNWFDRHGWTAVLASRFIPGSRLPLYVSAGALGKKPLRFAIWTMLAVMIWAPVMLIFVIVLGEAASSPFRRIFGNSWITIIVAAIVLLIIIRIIFLSFTRMGRAILIASVSRIWRWEFWPMWLFYLPVVPWIAWLTLRHRSFAVITAANPGIPSGGLVGESKHEILKQLPHEWIAAGDLIAEGELVGRASPASRDVSGSGQDEAGTGEGEAGTARPTQREERFLDIMQAHRWSYPIVIKPDVGERGAGVRIIHDLSEAIEALEEIPGPVLVQAYAPGPHEAGIFYVREPGRERGRIFSITDKEFQYLEGDGRSTVRELIWKHPRYRMQAQTFMRRFAEREDEILAEGQRMRVAEAGNHCQGTRFRDGSHLITPALEETIDRIAQRFEGFFFGRFDVRYADADELKGGRGFTIIELNGISSESTNIYDSKRGLFAAYRTLFAQWRELFRIGAANRARGANVTPLPTIIRDVWHHLRSRRADPVSD